MPPSFEGAVAPPVRNWMLLPDLGMTCYLLNPRAGGHRMLGYGLKYPISFAATHPGALSKRAAAS